jgi:hypothetical protein
MQIEKYLVKVASQKQVTAGDYLKSLEWIMKS